MNRINKVLKVSGTALLLSLIITSCTVTFGKKKEKEGVVFCETIGDKKMECEGKSSSFEAGPLYVKLTTKKKFKTDQLRATIYYIEGDVEKEVDTQMLNVDPDWNVITKSITLNLPGKYKVTFLNKDGEKLGQGTIKIEGVPVPKLTALEAKLQFCNAIGDNYACVDESTVFPPGKFFALLSTNRPIGTDKVIAKITVRDPENNVIGEPEVVEIPIQPEWNSVVRAMMLEEPSNCEIEFSLPDGTPLANGTASIYIEGDDDEMGE